MHIKSKNSILRAITFIGFVTALLLLTTAVLLAYLALIQEKTGAIKQSIVLYEKLHESKSYDTKLKKYLARNHLTMVTLKEAKTIMARGEQLVTDKDIHKTLHEANIEIFVENKHYFYAYKADADMFYFINETPMTPIPKYLALGTLILLILLYLLYRYIRKAMQPLQILHKNIDKFSRGERIEKVDLESDDEVALVANAFCEAASTIDLLQKSRILFLRNIMHELKTPITRGKLITHSLSEDVKDKEVLLETFNAMERHLKELSDIEAITSKSQSLQLKEYALIDIVENVYDILYFDEVQTNISNEIVKVDFNLFSLALKNLLDNARKYRKEKTDILLEYRDGIICVSNEGEAFTKDINNFFEPFTRDCGDSKTDGFGLGLYIVNEVVQRHGFELKYNYIDGRHNFSIGIVYNLFML